MANILNLLLIWQPDTPSKIYVTKRENWNSLGMNMRSESRIQVRGRRSSELRRPFRRSDTVAWAESSKIKWLATRFASQTPAGREALPTGFRVMLIPRRPSMRWADVKALNGRHYSCLLDSCSSCPSRDEDPLKHLNARQGRTETLLAPVRATRWSSGWQVLHIHKTGFFDGLICTFTLNNAKMMLYDKLRK